MNLELFLMTLIIVLVLIAGMAIGVIFSNKSLKGSCGGIGALFGDPEKPCMFCGKKDECPNEKKEKCNGENFVPVDEERA